MAPKRMCSFCRKNDKDFLIKIGEKNLFICQCCVETCNSVLADAHLSGKISLPSNVDTPKNDAISIRKLSPKKIVSYLDQHIIGQHKTKKLLSVAVSNHYKRVFPGVIEGELENVEIGKSNVLLIGPTGCGKTLLAQKLAEYLDVPFAIGDATTLTETGYVGDDVEHLILKLLNNAGGDVKAAERGIIYIDEIDKLRSTSGNVSITRDVSGQGVQQGLLKLIEGTLASVQTSGGRRHPQAATTQVDTSNILFICGGSFVGLDKIVAGRSHARKIGFLSEDVKSNEITGEDLIAYGIIPELVGRLPVVSIMEELKESDLVEVLTKPKNAIVKQYQKLFLLEGAKLKFTDEAIMKIANIAYQMKLGARGLRSVIEKFMVDLMYNCENQHEYVVDVDTVMTNVA